MNAATTVANFSLCGPLIPQSGVIVGGSWMLEQFFRDVVGLDGGRLVMAVPFVDGGIAELALRWEEMPHDRVDLVLVTGTSASRTAWYQLKRYRWRSLMICQNRNLHAKLYTFLSDMGFGRCLIGSHNLTSRALKVNLEAGVLLRSGPGNAELQDAVIACHEYILDLSKHSKILVDSTNWTGLNEIETNRGGCDD